MTLWVGYFGKTGTKLERTVIWKLNSNDIDNNVTISVSENKYMTQGGWKNGEDNTKMLAHGWKISFGWR